MRIAGMRKAGTHLSRLVRAAVEGEPFIIARAGGPAVRAVALDAPESGNRIGFAAERISVAGDFEGMGAREIRAMFPDGE